MLEMSCLSSILRMFRGLRDLGCSFTNMEKALCTYSISGYRDNFRSPLKISFQSHSNVNQAHVPKLVSPKLKC